MALVLFTARPANAQGDSIRLGLPVGHTRGCYFVGVTADNKFLISASDDLLIHVWRLNDGILYKRLNGYLLGLSKCGKYLLFSGNHGKEIHPILVTDKDNEISFDDFSFKNISADYIINKDESLYNYVQVFNKQNVKVCSIDLNGRTKTQFPLGIYNLNNKSILITATRENTGMVYDMSNGKLVKIIENHNNVLTSCKFNPSNSHFVLGSLDGTISVWQTDDLKLLYQTQSSNYNGSSAISNIVVTEKYIATASEDMIICVYDLKSGKKLFTKQALYSDTKDMILIDGNHICITDVEGCEGIYCIYDILSGLLLDEIDLWGKKEQYPLWYFPYMGLQENRLYKKGDKYCFSFEDSGIIIWDNNFKKAEKILSVRDYPGYHLLGNQSSILFVYNNNKLDVVDTYKEQIVDSFEIPFSKSLNPDPASHFFFMKQISDEELLLRDNKNNNLFLIKLKDRSVTTLGEVRFEDIYKAPNSNLLFIVYEEKISLFDIDNKKIIADWHFFNNNHSFFITENGLFDGDREIFEYSYWIIESANDSLNHFEVIDFAQLKDRYWEPGLWEKVMKGEKLRDMRGMNELKLYPTVDLGEIKDDKLPITLTKREGGYGKVEVNINGKEVEADARGDGFDTTKPVQVINYSLKDNSLLMPGKENEITVKAWSADGFVQSRGAVAIYTPAGKASTTLPSFYAVVCGVSQYGNHAINLPYAEPDARMVSNAIQLGAQNLFGKDKTFVYTLTSPGTIAPTKENIRKTLEEIQKKAKPEDILLLHLSGHGITWGGDANDFYYLTSEATQANADAYRDEVIRKNYTISTAEFTQWIKQIPALKQVMIIDACGSGTAIDNWLAARDVGYNQLKAIDRMKDRTGMFIITGCAADKKSYEASRFGHGLLTYALLQAMNGAALREDKFVDVSMLFQYANDKVPDLAKSVGSLQQPQVLIPKSGTFDIGILNEPDRKRITLANPKPVFVRSVFMNSDKLNDNLNLSTYLDEQLSNISAKGADAKLTFVDAREYSDGCKVTGTYSTSNNQWKLKGILKCGEKETAFEILAASENELKQKLLEKVNGSVK